MKTIIRLAQAQVNSVVGDFSYNAEKIKSYLARALDAGADIVTFPELAVTGYPPEDLLFKAHFIKRNMDALKSIVGSVGKIIAVVGFVDKKGSNIYNAAAIIHKKKIRAIYHKMLLPNYSVFDEMRYFKSGEKPSVFRIDDILFGMNICEDAWHIKGPTTTQAKRGARIILTINSSPYNIGKIGQREEIIRKNARENGVFISYTNMVGGQDELVFDGRSMLVDRSGRVIARARAFEEDLLVTDIDLAPVNKGKRPVSAGRISPVLKGSEEVYQALLLGLKDYVEKNGFKKVAMGLSGGIDSALVAALAVDALGKDNVTGLFMPSRYSSQESADDASRLAANLGIRYEVVSIESVFKSYLASLGKLFLGHESDIAEENLQARIRGNILMALSNKFGWLILTTGNKSEMSTGYATLYGDMAGGFAVIKDVPKTLVYKLSLYRNSISKVIPSSILTKEPTAELKPDQKDSDTLPAYAKLDPILKSYVEDDRDIKRMISSGLNRSDVLKVVGMVDRSEYKRRQSPPGIRITPKAFGKDRRMPITNRFKES